MHRRRISFFLAAACLCGTAAAQAPLDLRAAFDAAWSRQPEARAQAARRDALAAQRRAAGAWTPAPPALELTQRSDRLAHDRGERELALGLAVPLWLPAERGRALALADAEAGALDSRLRAAQLRVAGSVREAWWVLQRARIDADAARDRLVAARRLATDVARRLKAGDLARADQHQAEAAVAAAESALAQAEADVAAAVQPLVAVTGLPAASLPAPMPEAPPDEGAEAAVAAAASHAALADLQDRASVAEHAAALARTRTRDNPELTLATTRERSAHGEAAARSVTLGLRVPFGGGARHDARVAAALADADEARAQLALEHSRVQAEQQAARARVDAARVQLAAADRRAVLAREVRGFVDKAFRLGESDLPARLRVEAEAAEAERLAARARIDMAAAISAWRQALGLLPQ